MKKTIKTVDIDSNQQKPISNKKNRKEEKQAKKAAEKQSKKAEILYIDELAPIVDLDETYSYYIMRDGTIADVLRIECKDIYAVSEEDALMENLLWDRLLSIYSGDLKMIYLYYHTATDHQQAYLDHLARRTANPIYRELLSEAKLKYMEINRTTMTKNVFLMFFAKNLTEHDNNLIQIKSTLCRTYPPLVKDVSPRLKKWICFKLCNKTRN